MDRQRIVFAVAFWFFLSTALPAQEMHPAAGTSPAFDQLKALAGEWEGHNSPGMTVHLTYTVVSNGSVVMENLQHSKQDEMITMYSLDQDRLIVTHYCAAGNQPTLQTAPSPAANGKYDFTFVRAAGLKSPGEGHMVALSLILTDKDHLTQVWTYEDHGKSSTDTFNYTRIK
jgi:hypothetical protein